MGGRRNIGPYSFNAQKNFQKLPYRVGVSRVKKNCRNDPKYQVLLFIRK